MKAAKFTKTAILSIQVDFRSRYFSSAASRRASKHFYLEPSIAGKLRALARDILEETRKGKQEQSRRDKRRFT